MIADHGVTKNLPTFMRYVIQQEMLKLRREGFDDRNMDKGNPMIYAQRTARITNFKVMSRVPRSAPFPHPERGLPAE